MVTNTLHNLHTFNELRDQLTYKQLKTIFACNIGEAEKQRR